MNILDSIVGAGNGASIDQLSSQFGLKPEQTSSAVAALVPALAAGLQRNMSTDTGLAGLVSALSGGGHQVYLDNPRSLSEPATTADGNAILGHVFGSKDVSRQVAARASQQTGIDASILKQMLPLLAAMAMGGLSRKAASSGTTPSDARSAGAGLASMLEPLLDRDRDGSMLDDVAGMLGGMLGPRGRS